MSTEFGTWLNEQMHLRGWSMSELGRRARVSHAQVSNVINGVKPPGHKFCIGIARALRPYGITAQEVFQRAGLLGYESAARTDTTMDLTIEFAQLSDDDRAAILKLVRALNAVSKLVDPGD